MKTGKAVRRGLLLVFTLGLAATLWWGHGEWQAYQRFIDAPLANGGSERVIEVAPGDSFRFVLGKLRKLGVAEGRDEYWRYLAWDLGVMRKLQVGEYLLFHGITPRELLTRMERGRVIQHRFTIIPGWTFRDLRLALAENPVLGQTLPGLSETEVLKRLGLQATSAEGRFLPETYHFARGISDLDILNRARLAMDQALQRHWDERADDLPLETPEQALVLASIIEKETGLAAERPEIAGVFIRRLRLGMKLQTDPTVIFGLGESFDGATPFYVQRYGSAHLLASGADIWNADNGFLRFGTSNPERLRIDQLGNVGIGTTAPTEKLHVVGNITATGTISQTSDRNAKFNIVETDVSDILDRIARVPISFWTYKTDSLKARHMGPMAQDFYAAFGLGDSNRVISPLDAAGVALAAIQALNEKLAERDSKIEMLERRIDLLTSSVAKIAERRPSDEKYANADEALSK